MKTILRSAVSVFAALAMTNVFNPTPATAGFDELVDLIGSPTDGGTGPRLWYQTAREPNQGSGATHRTLTAGNNAMTVQRPDFFGNPNGAFALAGTNGGAAVSDGTASPYLTGSQGTFVMTFQTPPAITANSSIFNRGDGSTGVGNPKFEIYLLANGTLRVTTGDTQFGVITAVGTLAADTWYYLAVSWDLNLPSNRIAWYWGEMGSATLNSGFVSDSVAVIGNPASPIRAGGRSSFDTFTGSFQNIAIYNRHLTAQAIQDQFAEAALPQPQIGVYQPEEPIEGVFQNFTFGSVFLADGQNDSEPRTVRFVNITETDVVVEDLYLGNDGDGAFFITGAPATPFTIEPDETFDVEVSVGGAITGGTLVTGTLEIVSNFASEAGGLTPRILEQDLSAVVYTTGDSYLLNSNPTLDENLSGWVGGGTLVSPGFDGSARKVRVKGRNDGDPDSFGQVLSTNAASDFELRFLMAIPNYQTAVGSSPDGNYGDRSFQLIVQSAAGIPGSGGSWTNSHAASAMINLAYLPAGNGSTGEGFYLFNGSSWQLVSELGTLQKSIDADTNGALNPGAGDTAYVYQVTIAGSGFGSNGASYDISVSEPNSTDVAATATGLTTYHSSPIDENRPAAFTFTTGDRSDSSGNGTLDPIWSSSFWLDEIFFSLGETLPFPISTVASSNVVVRAWPDEIGATVFAMRNDGLGSDLNVLAFDSGDTRFGTVAPALPSTVAPGETELFTVGYDTAGLTGEGLYFTDFSVTTDSVLTTVHQVPVEVLVFAPGNYIFGSFEVPGTDTENNTDTFAGWQETGASHLVTAVPGLVAGSNTAAYVHGSETSFSADNNGTLLTKTLAPLVEFDLEFYFAIKQAGAPGRRTFSIELEGPESESRVNIRYEDGVWSAFDGAWNPFLEMALTPSVDANGNGSLDDPGDTKVVYRLHIAGRNWDNADQDYDVAVYDAEGNLIDSAENLQYFRVGTNNEGLYFPLGEVQMSATWGANPGFWVDEMMLTGVPAVEPPSGDIRITSFAYDPQATENVTLRWTDVGSAYEIEAASTLPFGGAGDLLIPVDSSNGTLDTESHPGEIEFSFEDPDAAQADRRFWRVRIVQP